MAMVEVSTEYGGRKLTLQTGRIAKQADASVLVTYGETVVLVTVVSSRDLKPGQDFFPLTVDFQEKYYAAGRMPGGFFKREAKPSDKATLSARMTDRPLRPLFPEDYMFETNIVATVLSVDTENEYDFLAQIGASAALHISDIPFNGPVAACRIGMKDGEYVLNIPPAEQPESSMELLVSGVRDGVVMVEGKSEEVSEKELLEAIFFAHEKMQPIMDLQDELREKTGNRAKRDYDKPVKDEELKKKLWDFLPGPVADAMAVRDKLERYAALDKVKKSAKEKFGIKEPKSAADELHNKNLSAYFGDFKHEWARTHTLKTKKRI
ncbi:MAG: polyribonucleotide nucleotidyltransferase, partial [Bdellovibrionales bacterium]|nr:polyribonucleotide nucleotidyltransferase [Bdellovibrionales bacterium]